MPPFHFAVQHNQYSIIYAHPFSFLGYHSYYCLIIIYFSTSSKMVTSDIKHFKLIRPDHGYIRLPGELGCHLTLRRHLTPSG